jgi:putative tryptophan/tyrosine transport system substrate-binding protein
VRDVAASGGSVSRTSRRCGTLAAVSLLTGMDRRRFLLTSLAAAVAAPLLASAQQPEKVWRIGVLWFTVPSVSSPFFEALRQGLHELGYREGRNIVFEQRWAERNPERYPELAADLVQRGVHVIVAGNLESSLAAKRATTTIPIVLTAGGDPVRAGVVASLARPGGNATGLSELSPDLTPKLLQFLHEAVPRLSRVAVLWNPDNPSSVPTLEEMEGAAQRFKITLQPLVVRRPQDFVRTFSALDQHLPDALIVYVIPITYGHRAEILDFVVKRRLPAIYSAREFVDVGGLMSYGPNLRELFRRSATYVDKILRGSRPGDLPVEQPTKFELVINLKTARTLGLTIPPSLLARADQVIE